MSGRVTLAGSERVEVPGSRRVGAVPPDERISVSVVLAPRQRVDAQDRMSAATNEQHGQRSYVAPEDVEKVFGADPASAERVREFAAAHRLSVDDVNLARRTVRLSGTVADVCAAFETSVERFEYEGATYRGRTGALTIPEELDGVITAVFGIDDRPVARHHAVSPLPASTSNTLSALQVAAAYKFPAGFDGSGQTVGIIEFGGGYRQQDLADFASGLGVAAPQTVDVSVDGATNSPQAPPAKQGDPDFDLEVALDIEVVGAIAPAAKIPVYFAPNTTAGWHDAISTAITDTANSPSVLSISWGASENSAFFSTAVMNDISTLLAQAVQTGITVLFSSGDFGSANAPKSQQTDQLAHVDFPASDPNATGCGGTVLTLDANGAITAEEVWNNGTSSSGGGISDVFDVPTFQGNAAIPASANPGGRVGRGVPDVAGHADAYSIQLRGQSTSALGTSAVAPLWAGLVARINQALGRRAGLLNPTLYGGVVAANGFNDITSGSNGAYSAGAGWDACTGLGSPIGERILAVLRGPAAVTSVSPTSGPPGTSITVTGTGFTGASAVGFGSTAADTFSVDSDTQITVTAPNGAGTVDITVTTPGGASATGADDQFTFTSAGSGQ